VVVDADGDVFSTARVVEKGQTFRVVVRAPEEGDGVWLADLDLTELRRIRQTLPALQQRRLGLTC